MASQNHKTISIVFPEARFASKFATIYQNSKWHVSHGIYCSIQDNTVRMNIRKDILRSVQVHTGTSGLTLWFWDAATQMSFRGTSKIWFAPYAPMPPAAAHDGFILSIRQQWTVADLQAALATS